MRVFKLAIGLEDDKDYRNWFTCCFGYDFVEFLHED